MTFPKIQVLPKSGNEPFEMAGEVLPFALIDFWRWSNSDLVSNTLRGVLAEFIISKALCIAHPDTREEWAPWDLTTPEGIKVEVKSASYIQSWHQDCLSKITFLTPKTHAWDANTNKQDPSVQRQADVYVLALLAHQRQETINPLDLAQWQFWIVPTSLLDSRTRSQHSITLPSLVALAGEPIPYISIRKALIEVTARSA